ncbi:hypothetical protein FOZ60_009503 [Perkinsus olseni]|uniref:Uncharacterized protein n=1 Tax=Perkinsus olseni TaxID=32597 RepID=A0A7J6NHI6_PEROL|nr:hypothetical protein FOZ60_009503 [Perkinsus olseni]
MVPGTPLVNILQLAVLSGAAPETPPPYRSNHNVSAVPLDTSYRRWPEQYPFAGKYSFTSDKIGTVEVVNTPEVNITFYRKSNTSLPKPSYGCGFKAFQSRIVPDWWALTLQDACKALIEYSGGYCNKKIMTGIFVAMTRGFLGVPRGQSDRSIDVCFVVTSGATARQLV